MKPVTVSIEVPQSPDEVFDHLDVLANHEPFTDHFLVDWETSGPERGVGARARMRVKKPGPEDWLEMEVIESERPRRNVERATGREGQAAHPGKLTSSRRSRAAAPRSASSSPGSRRREGSA